MPDNKSDKPGGKTGELLLGLLGTLGSIAGPMFTGQNIDFGLPFKLGASYLNDNRMKNDLMKALQSNPHTDAIGADVAAITGSGKSLMDVLQNPALLGELPSLKATSPQSQPSLMGGQRLQGPEQGLAPLPQETPVEVPVTQPTAQPGMSDAEYLQSPDFLQALAKFRPDLAEDVAKSKAIQQPKVVDPIDQILKVMALQNYESPARKREIENKEWDYRTSRVNQNTVERQLGTAENRAQIKKETWTQPEDNAVAGHLQGEAATRNMLDQLDTGGMPSITAKVVSSSAFWSGLFTKMGFTIPKDIQMSRDIDQMVMYVVKQQSGVQYGYRELQWIKATQPSKWDTPELFKNGVSMMLNESIYNRMALLAGKAKKASNINVALDKGVTMEQLDAFDILSEQLGERATKGGNDSRLFADPKNAELLKTLGMVQLDEPVTR